MLGLAISITLSLASGQSAESSEQVPDLEQNADHQSVAKDVDPQASQASEEADKIICKRTRITGSKFNQKLCGTQAQWDAMEGRNRESGRKMQRDGKGLSPNGS